MNEGYYNGNYMGRKIVNEPAKLMRKLARKALKNNWLTVSLVHFLYMMLTSGVTMVLSILLYNTLGIASSIYTIAVTGAFMFGMVHFMITFFRTGKTRIEGLFSGFEYFPKAFGLYFMMGLFIFLWSLLLIVPGIIAAYRYSMAFYILADDPTKGIMQCLNESRERMTGNKSKLFFLQLSFIGYALLSVIPMAILFVKALPTTESYYNITSGSVSASAYYSPELAMNTGLFLILFVLSCIPIAFYSAYEGTATVVFYDLLTGHLVQRPRAAGQMPGGTQNGNAQYSNAPYGNTQYGQGNGQYGSDPYNNQQYGNPNSSTPYGENGQQYGNPNSSAPYGQNDQQYGSPYSNTPQNNAPYGQNDAQSGQNSASYGQSDAPYSQTPGQQTQQPQGTQGQQYPQQDQNSTDNNADNSTDNRTEQ
jgi:uncharacterized membrane protein